MFNDWRVWVTWSRLNLCTSIGAMSFIHTIVVVIMISISSSSSSSPQVLLHCDLDCGAGRVAASCLSAQHFR